MWNSDGTEIFSCSVDGFICHLDIKNSKLLSKFHTNYNSDKSVGNTKTRNGMGRGREPLHSICLHPSERSVVVGSVSRLTWIDLDTKSCLKTFEGGHIGAVTSLTMLQLWKQCFVLSAGNSSDDYTISVWKLSLDDDLKPNDATKSSRAQASDSIVAKFSLNECVRSIFVQQPSNEKVDRSKSENDELLVGAITKTGVLHCFKHEFSSPKKKKPIKPKKSLQVCDVFFVSRLYL